VILPDKETYYRALAFAAVLSNPFPDLDADTDLHDLAEKYLKLIRHFAEEQSSFSHVNADSAVQNRRSS
jgi:hypothetical protein